MAENEHKIWTTGMGLRRCLGSGLVVAVLLGVVIVFLARYVALPWSIKLGGSGFGDYRLGFRVMLVLAAGFGFAWLVAATCERAGGMASILFEPFTVLCAALLGVVLTLMAMGQARALADEPATFPMAALVVAVPTVAGAVIAVWLRRL